MAWRASLMARPLLRQAQDEGYWEAGETYAAKIHLVLSLSKHENAAPAPVVIEN